MAEKLIEMIEDVNEFMDDVGETSTKEGKKFRESATKSPLNTGHLNTIMPSRKVELSNEYILIEDLPTEKVKLKKNNGELGNSQEIPVPRTDIPQLVVSDREHQHRTFYVDYSTIFNRNDLEKYEDLFYYNMSNRTYASIVDPILHDLNFVLNEYPELGMKLLNIRTTAYRERDKYTDDRFFEDIRKIIMDREFRSIVIEIIESTYDVNLDEKNAKNVNKIVDLQVTDAVNKSFLAAALMQRVLIPFINQYLVDTSGYWGMTANDVKARTNQSFIHIFTFIITLFAREYNVDNINKLYKIVQPRITRTNYPHKVMWGMLEDRGEDNSIAINEIMVDKVIRNIICKLNPNSSSIAFISTVIKNTINYKFKFNYNYKYHPFSLSMDDDSEDEMDPLERFSMNNHHRRNELDDLINRIAMKEYIDNKFKEYGITDEEYKVHFDRFKRINDFQKLIISIYFTDEFQITEYNRSDIVSLLLIISKDLDMKNIPNISKTLLGKVISGEKGRSSGKTSYDILSDTAYQDAVSRYTIIDDVLSRDNFVLKLASVHGYNFSIINDELKEEEFSIPIDKKNFTAEIAEFISQI